MDGNRRWAKSKGFPTFEGHRAGGETMKKIITVARDAGIEHIIFFTFSTENWDRSKVEVLYLLNLIGKFLQKELDYFDSEGGILHYVGDLSRFSPKLQKMFKESEEKTAKNSGISVPLNVYFALNYGGRQEIISAVKKMLVENPKPEDIDEKYFAAHLQTGAMPDPDLIIRTSGEMRLSGFLPWQSVYSELFFTDTLWPDFSEREFLKILEEYKKRERRIGK